MLGNIGTGELVVIGVVILLLFGTKKLNELARGLGESTKEFKKVKTEYQKAVRDEPMGKNGEKKENKKEVKEKKAKEKKKGGDNEE